MHRQLAPIAQKKTTASATVFVALAEAVVAAAPGTAVEAADAEKQAPVPSQAELEFQARQRIQTLASSALADDLKANWENYTLSAESQEFQNAKAKYAAACSSLERAFFKKEDVSMITPELDAAARELLAASGKILASAQASDAELIKLVNDKFKPSIDAAVKRLTNPTAAADDEDDFGYEDDEDDQDAPYSA